jgi:branched-chain amino acid aminotransferase
MNAFRLEPLKREQGADNILYCFQGKVLECPRDNFFLIHGDTLVSARENVLHGITRQVVLNLARDMMNVEEREVSVGELDTADEALISSTSMQIVPVVQIDDRAIGGGAVGKNVQALMTRFDEYIKNYDSE